MWPFLPGRTEADPDTLPMIPAAEPATEPRLPALIFCCGAGCGCTYVGQCPTHSPEEGKYEP